MNLKVANIPSFATRAIAAEHLEDIERMAQALRTTRGAVMRKMIREWFEMKGSNVENIVHSLDHLPLNERVRSLLDWSEAEAIVLDIATAYEIPRHAVIKMLADGVDFSKIQP